MTSVTERNKQKKRMLIVDKLMLVAAVAHPLSGLPQILQIYSTQDVAGVSLVTWIGFMLIGIIYLYYGILHKLKPIVITQLLWFAVDLAVVIGVLLYR